MTNIDIRRIKKIETIFKKNGGNKSAIGLSLVKEALFMAETLLELKETVKQSGAIEHFANGKQNFYREHPALKSYNTTLKNFQNVMKQLYEILPEDKNQNDEMLDFIKGKK